MIESLITADHIYRCVLWDIYSTNKCSVGSQFEDLTANPFPTYDSDLDGVQNRHHWVFPYVWGTFFPYLAKKLDIPFNPNDFRLLKDPDGDFRYNRHLWKCNFKCDAYRFKTKSVTCHTYTDCCMGGGISKYHAVIRYPHETILYRRGPVPGVETDRKLLLNCDSMSIPLIPLLLPYYSEILCLDFRYDMGKDDYTVIESFEFTDYACIMYERGYLLNKHTGHNLTYDPNLVKPVKPACVVKDSRRDRILKQVRRFRKHR